MQRDRYCLWSLFVSVGLWACGTGQATVSDCDAPPDTVTCGTGTTLIAGVCEADPGLSCGVGTVAAGMSCVGLDQAGPSGYCKASVEPGAGDIEIVSLNTTTVTNAAIAWTGTTMRVFWIEAGQEQTLKTVAVSASGGLGTSTALGTRSTQAYVEDMFAAAHATAAAVALPGIVDSGNDQLFVVDAADGRVAEVTPPRNLRALLATHDSFVVVTDQLLVPLSASGILGAAVPLVSGTATIQRAALASDTLLGVLYGDTATPGRLWLKTVDLAGVEQQAPLSVFAEQATDITAESLRFAGNRFAVVARLSQTASGTLTTSLLMCNLAPLACNPPHELYAGTTLGTFIYAGAFGYYPRTDLLTDPNGIPGTSQFGTIDRLGLTNVLPFTTDIGAPVSDRRIAVLGVKTQGSDSRLWLTLAGCP